MPSLRDAESDLARALARLERRTAYADVMAQRSSGHGLNLDRQTTSPRPLPMLEGAVFRAWDGATWVESAASGLTDHALVASVDHLLGRLPTTPGKAPPGESPTGHAEKTTVEQRPAADFGIEAQIEWAKTRLDWATAVPGIENAFVNLLFESDERLFLSTAGAVRHQRLQYALGAVVPLAIEGNRVETDRVAEGRTGGVEVLDAITEEVVMHASREAKELLSAKSPPTGMMNVLLDPSTTGTFAHESFGHGAEADQVLRGRSYLAPLLGKVLGPECLTLVDNGALPGGWGSIFFDDEGHDAQRTVLVDRGRFVEVLSDRESAAQLGRRPTGNTRRADFLSRPFVRMTNTYVEPGDRSFEELIAEAKDGVVLQNFMSGIEDPLGGNMQLKVKKGRRIEHGELTEIFSSTALSGKVLEFLQEIKGVSRASDMEFTSGACGKGHTDMLNTGTGGPYLLSRAVVGPG
ncbi:MAG TPA: TldD/PmbA family protein [Thermoplasmata archaeon]|nr:TldD/PmbA family protein [Thermoplasmata archaeon]